MRNAVLRTPAPRALIAVLAMLFSTSAAAAPQPAHLPWDRVEAAVWNKGAAWMDAAGVSPASQRALAKAARAAAPALRPVEARIDAWAGEALAWLLAPEIDAIEAERLRDDGVQIVDDASRALLPAVVDGATALRPSERAALVREAKRALR
jgi:hypothetical protein